METADHTEQSGKITWRTIVACGALLTIGIAAFLLINSAGTRLKAPAPASNQELFVQGVTLAQFETLLHLLLALAVILIAARGAGLLFRRIGQPPVIGEVIAGILLGPSLLATALPEVHAYLLPDSIAPLIGVIAQVGIVLYMFLVGLEVNPAVIRSNSNAVLTISQTSIIVPFLSGAALALLLYPVFSTNDVPFPVFLLFMGISMSVTAFPVLVRILTDNGMQRSRLGVIATTCAALNDVTAWCMLAFVVGVAKASFEDAVQTLVLTGLYLIFMIVVVRRLMLHMVRRAEAKPEIGQTTVGIMLLLLLMSSFTTEWIGIHGLFGAFLLGAIVPPDCRLALGLRQRFHDLVVVLFLPAYFAFTGMRTEVGLIAGADQWLFLGIIILVASLGKFGLACWQHASVACSGARVRRSGF